VSAGALLGRCGVRPDSLSAAQRAALDARGFVVLAGLLDAGALAAARAAFERVVGPAPLVAGKPSGTRHADADAQAGVLSGEPDLAFALAHPCLLAAADHVLGRPFRPLQLGARDPLPGFGAQGLHADWLPRAPGEPFAVVTALWMLDDFRADNGATRVVPGSHRTVGTVPRQLAQPDSRHPGEEIVTGCAGSALVFNGHLWHAGRRNASRGARRALQVQLVARAAASPEAGLRALPAHFGPAVRALFEGEAEESA
jgi:ectoine hydroxylase-related dioxygenase (phytanoyl-CoA dioxygenase family)